MGQQAAEIKELTVWFSSTHLISTKYPQLSSSSK